MTYQQLLIAHVSNFLVHCCVGACSTPYITENSGSFTNCRPRRFSMTIIEIFQNLVHGSNIAHGDDVSRRRMAGNRIEDC